MHFVDEGVDTGDLVAQLEIPYTWEDTGGSLRAKACDAMVQLFKETYPLLRSGKIDRAAQDLDRGTFHLANEIEAASEIQLDQSYSARKLLNLLRARTFPGYPSCWFSEDGAEYEVRVTVKRKTK